MGSTQMPHMVVNQWEGGGAHCSLSLILPVVEKACSWVLSNCRPSPTVALLHHKEDQLPATHMVYGAGSSAVVPAASHPSGL